MTTRIVLEKELVEAKKQKAANSAYDAVMTENAVNEDSISNVKTRMEEYALLEDELKRWSDDLEEEIAAGDEVSAERSRTHIDGLKIRMDTAKADLLASVQAMKSCLYVDIRSTMNSGGFSTYSAVAAKASNGKWIVFYTSYYGGESNPFSSTNSKTLYYNTPTLDSMSSDIAPSTGANGYPYIIHPCPDFSGGSLSDLFFIDHMPKFDSQNPPVITSGKSVFVIPPYPNRYANTAAFAIEIDPADY